MPWKPTDEMTRDELVAQLVHLRDVVERLMVQTPQPRRGFLATLADMAPFDDEEALPYAGGKGRG